MASLKEVKARISSVNSTLKITSAMRMISSVKLHHALSEISNLKPYQKVLKDILSEVLTERADLTSPYLEVRPVKKVAIVAISSSTSLCGSFNVNIEKMVKSVIDEYKNLGTENILLFTIGKKIAKHLSNQNLHFENFEPNLSEKPDYKDSVDVAQKLMNLFKEGKVDRVEIIYNHLKSVAVQIPVRELYLPLVPETNVQKHPEFYIFEPDIDSMSLELIENILKYAIFTALSDSVAAEHAARTVAMQMASDNASKLIQELTIQYNKTRQQAITSELLDIMGGMSR